jgi:poly(A) polymerase
MKSKAILIKEKIEQLYPDNKFINEHCYIVGGFVRDILLGIQPKDIDIVVDKHYGSLKLGLMIHKAISKEITKPRRLGNYPIWQLTFISGELAGESIEIAESMTEEFPDISTRQRIVKYASLKDDIYRRDFTINSLLMKFNKGNNIGSIVDISDYGLKDLLENKLIRCLPNINPEDIFYADPLRIIRAVRFSIKYDWEIEKTTFQAMKNVKDRINILSKERILSELKNICQYEYGLLKAILLFDKLEILELIFPEVAALKNIKQAPDSRNIHLEGSIYKCKNFVSINGN